MRRIRATATLVTALVALAVPAAAAADWRDVVRDCSDDGKFSREYRHEDYRHARDNMPTDIDEYTDCRAMINAKLGSGGTGAPGAPGGGSTGGGNSSPPSSDPGATTKSGATGGSAADVSALKTETEQAKSGRPSIVAGGRTVSPASSGLDRVAGAANEVPASLLIAIALVAGLCGVGGAIAARRRWPVIVRAPLRLIRR